MAHSSDDDTVLSKELIETVSLEIQNGASPTVAQCFKDRGAPPPELDFDPDPASIEDPRLSRIFAYWNGLPRQSDLPSADAIDPIEFVEVLSITMMLDVIDDGWDFRYRVYGEEVASRFGHHMVGKRTSEIPIPPSVTLLFLAGYRAVIASRKPLLSLHAAPPQVTVTSWRRLILPLVDKDDAVSSILVGNSPGTWRKVDE